MEAKQTVAKSFVFKIQVGDRAHQLQPFDGQRPDKDYCYVLDFEQCIELVEQAPR